MPYTPTAYVDNSAPALSAVNLNKAETGIQTAQAAAETAQATATAAATTAYATSRAVALALVLGG